MYSRFGLPFAGGPAEQPAHLMDVINAMTIADEQISAAKAKKHGH
jgi:hypothetical protein